MHQPMNFYSATKLFGVVTDFWVRDVQLFQRTTQTSALQKRRNSGRSRIMCSRLDPKVAHTAQNLIGGGHRESPRAGHRFLLEIYFTARMITSPSYSVDWNRETPIVNEKALWWPSSISFRPALLLGGEQQGCFIFVLSDSHTTLIFLSYSN